MLCCFTSLLSVLLFSVVFINNLLLHLVLVIGAIVCVIKNRDSQLLSMFAISVLLVSVFAIVMQMFLNSPPNDYWFDYRKANPIIVWIPYVLCLIPLFLLSITKKKTEIWILFGLSAIILFPIFQLLGVVPASLAVFAIVPLIISLIGFFLISTFQTQNAITKCVSIGATLSAVIRLFYHLVMMDLLLDYSGENVYFFFELLKVFTIIGDLVMAAFFINLMIRSQMTLKWVCLPAVIAFCLLGGVDIIGPFNLDYIWITLPVVTSFLLVISFYRLYKLL